MLKITISQTGTWRVALGERPRAALMSIGVHGPALMERYCVEHYWCIHLYTYWGEVTIDGRKFEIAPGRVSILPPGAETIYSFPAKSYHACSHFALPGSLSESAVEMPAMQDLGPRFERHYRAMEEAIALFPSNRLQAEVRLWDLLWQLAHPMRSRDLPTNRVHPAVHRCVELIELRLSEPLAVASLAADVGLSHNHLTRLFRESMDSTVTGYIQRRRVEKAEHLLRDSQLPIKTIAAQVGVGDPCHFNKLIHKTLGASPIEVRRRVL